MKNNFLAILFGILVTLALPPIFLFPLAIIGLSGFFWMILKCKSAKEALKIGWWFGFGHFTSGLYWIAFALLFEFKDYWWLTPFAIFGIPAVVAVYMAIVALITWQIKKYININGWQLVVCFACTWTTVEMLRGVLFTGFPWNLIGYIWTFSDNMLQFTSVTGIWGLSLITVLSFTMPALLIPIFIKKKYTALLPHLAPLMISTFVLICIFAWGGYRLYGVQTQFVPNVKLRLVQPNIEQGMKWDDAWRVHIVRTYLEMTKSPGFENITHVIWPETALPFMIDQDSPLMYTIAKVTPKTGALIMGALRSELTADKKDWSLMNSIEVVTPDSKLYSMRDKSHLVPFGEYIPFRSLVPFKKITNGSKDFSASAGVSTISAPAMPDLSGLMCYEIIFPGRVVDKNNRPGVIVNVTNDGWFGRTTGPYQHFQMARTRAVEEGIPVIRAANSGISAVIDPYGRVIGKTELAKSAILDEQLPARLSAVTIYGRYRDLVVILSMVILLIFSHISTIFRGDKVLN